MMVFILIRNLRWWIGGLLFASTVINYIDRQTLSVLAPALKDQYHWTNTDFATVLIAFRVGLHHHAVGLRAACWTGWARAGACRSAWRFIPRWRRARRSRAGLGGFRIFRGLLGAGESAGWPGAAKAVSEWFPDRERAWAVALFDSGSSIGGAVAPFLVLFLVSHLRLVASGVPDHLEPGLPLADRVEEGVPHARNAPPHYAGGAETDPARPAAPAKLKSPRLRVAASRYPQLLRFRQTWGIVVRPLASRPYWFMIAEWFAIYLASKGFRMEESALGFWAPFHGRRSRQFFRRRSVELLDPPRLDRGQVAAHGGGDLRPGHAAADSGGVQLALLAAGGSVRVRHVLLCGLLHDLHLAACRCVSKRARWPPSAA